MFKKKAHLQYSIYNCINFLSVFPSCQTDIYIYESIQCMDMYIYMDSHVLCNTVNGRKVFNQIAVEIETVHV